MAVTAVIKSLVCVVLVPVLAIIASVVLNTTSVADLSSYESPITGVGLPPMAVFRVATKFSALVDAFAFALKPPTAQVMSMVNGYQLTQALGVFARLHLAEAMLKLANRDGMTDVIVLATEVGVDAEALRRLLRFLAAHSFVASSGGPLAQRFGLTPASQMLAKDATGSLWGAAVIGSADHYDGWQNLEASLRKGASTVAFDDKFGLSIWEHYKRNPTQEKAFAHFMTGVSAGPNAALAMSGVNFSQCERIVDVGGGHGSLMQELVAAFPSLSGAATVFDMPSVVRSAPTIHGVHFKGGDFFDPKTIPRGASTNCYVEKVVLHDWSDTKTVAILKNIATALETAKVPRANRRLFLAEQVLSDGDALQVSKLGLDVNMMVMCGGGERTAGEWAALLDQAGWSMSSVFPTRSLFSVIEAVAK